MKVGPCDPVGGCPRAWRSTDSIASWLEYASSSGSAGASISTYLEPTEVVALGSAISDRFAEVVALFKPVLEWLDGDEQIQPDTPSPKPSTGHRVWILTPGEGGRLWEDFKRYSIAGIGWDFLGDLRQYQSHDHVIEALRAVRSDGIEPIHDSLACWQFLRRIQPGDLIYAKRGQREIIGRGVVQSDYQFDPNRSEYKHIRKVRWDRTGSWQLPADQRLPVKTLTGITRRGVLAGDTRRADRAVATTMS